MELKQIVIITKDRAEPAGITLYFHTGLEIH